MMVQKHCSFYQETIPILEKWAKHRGLDFTALVRTIVTGAAQEWDREERMKELEMQLLEAKVNDKSTKENPRPGVIHSNRSHSD